MTITLEDVREAKAVLDMMIDNQDADEVRRWLEKAQYHPEDAEDLVGAAERLLRIANNTQT